MAARGTRWSWQMWYSRQERVGFGHRRLTINRPSDRGAQPMVSTDGNASHRHSMGKSIITGIAWFLRKGVQFHTQTDTEVLLHLYADKGEAMVNDLRGMFAFGLPGLQLKQGLYWRAIPMVLSRFTMPTTGGPSALRPRSRLCSPVGRFHGIENRPVGSDFVCLAAFRAVYDVSRNPCLAGGFDALGGSCWPSAYQAVFSLSPKRTAKRRLWARA